MLRRDVRALAVGWFVVIFLAASSAAQTESNGYDQTISRALVLLPKQPEKVLVVDAAEAARARDAHGRRVQAFVRHGENVVYLIAQGDTLQRGQKGAGVFDYVLATIIWHEMAHIGGADEPEAQRQEEELWKEYVAAGRMDTGRGLSYLALLRKRHQDPSHYLDDLVGNVRTVPPARPDAPRVTRRPLTRVTAWTH